MVTSLLFKYTCIKKWLFETQYKENIGKEIKKQGSSRVLDSESDNDQL